ncbi:MAG: efflux RND transporter permease subunit [Desulfamplus sp.]|nr:efflux RND transporter permease subunit [Desulfamplus sp.]
MSSFFNFILKRSAFTNAIMVAIIMGGLFTAKTIRQELMPAQEANMIELSVELPGASPDEINSSILVVIENAVRGINGIKRVDAKAREGSGSVTITLLENSDSQEMLGDIKSAVDRIETFPEDAEKPVITIPSQVEKALSIVIYGKQPLMWLRKTAEIVRDDLRTQRGLKKVELAFPRELEISVETSEHTLRQYGLTIEDLAEKIREDTPNLPGGTLYSSEADIALRTSEHRDWAKEFSDIAIAQTSNGIPLRLADIAELKDGFGTSSIECWFNGQPAVQIDVFAVGDESPISVEDAVRDYLDTIAPDKFQGVNMVIFENQASAYRSRMTLLVENALQGLILVLITLGLFLTPRLAFWVANGIPTSMLGGLLILPLFGGTLNMLSLFAFIVTIGIVVDDATVIGEAVYANRQKGMSPLSAVLQGMKEMGGPVILATSTTIIAFMPMFFVPGEMGVLFYQIPAVVTAVLLASLFECFFIMGAHLYEEHPEPPWLKVLAHPQKVVNDRLEKFIKYRFRPFIQASLKNSSIVYASFLSVLLITIGAVSADFLDFSFTPTIDSDMVISQAALQYGTPKSQSVKIQQKLVETANAVLKESNMKSPGIFSLIGTRLEEGEVEEETLVGFHYISVLMALPKVEERKLSGREFSIAWQKAFGDYGELESLNFSGETKITGGEPIMLEVFHTDQMIAKEAALSLGQRLRTISGLTSVDDGVHAGKPELNIRLKDFGLQMGLTSEMAAKQIRHRYHGAEAFRFVRDGNEIKVMVRLNEKERSQIASLQEILLKSPSGSLLPLTEVAEITQTRSFTSLARRDGKRIYPVTADIGFGIDDDIIEDVLEDAIIPQVIADFSGLSINFGGEEEENDEALGFLGKGFLIILGVFFLIFTFHYNNYIQPILILLIIPLSTIGAIWGHILIGCDLSIVSVIGIIAMAGVVVNDTIVLVSTYNQYCIDGQPPFQAIVDAACNRFRPILLTSLTTFFGLMPLLLERSEQAQFLIPAAVSIGFGLIVSTVTTLVLMPSLLYLFRNESEITYPNAPSLYIEKVRGEVNGQVI